MTLVLSVDLAYKTYENFGFCLLEESFGSVTNIRYFSYHEIGLGGIPEPNSFAKIVLKYCLDTKVTILMLDGSQGWKDPNNGLLHQRVCEKCLNTMAKTGTYGEVKPANFKPFISFTIDVFNIFYSHSNDWVSLVSDSKITMPSKGFLLVETYPHEAWKKLNMKPLGAKRRCTSELINQYIQDLRERLKLPETKITPTHDQLSALVAGLAGVAIAAGDDSGYIASGVAPRLTPQGHWVEGYIVNPR